ncbi:helix-turn-helix transcriptional regulator [Actinocorallia sp. API 0066]|uniref:helix-turn-helix domain-containing protein n=1 Tax=Actinocorallia sp. API 0066 TaxID=2896846 RepID=UPI001E540C98|nr:helix-turn-helix transcriptional regulator [Actinocorallia sp. API 0066]MCD0451340.1 helix-turn-helix transcriptional regulator [Actinocorallia sp. API 0066]
MAASPSSSAQRALQDLSDRLRELRLDAGLTASALAAVIGWRGHTKVSKIEHGARLPSAADIRAWCTACGAAEQVPELLAVLRNVKGAYLEWTRLHRGGLRQLQQAWVPLWERTRRFRIYEPGIIPGLLQTPAYAEHLLRLIAEFRGTPTDDLAEAVAARMDRQRVLSTGRTFAFVLEESTLRARYGDPAVMAEQLDRLIKASRLPNVSLGVIPANTERVIWPPESFWIYDDAQVSIESVTALITVTNPTEIAVYGRTFERLAQMTVVGNQAQALIASARDEL